MLGLRDHICPSAALRGVGRVHSHQSVLGGVDVGLEQEFAVEVVYNAGAGVESIDHHLPIGVGVGQVFDVKVVAVGAGGGIEDEVAVVLGGVSEVVAVGLVVVAEDQLVFALRRAQLVEVHAVKGVLCAEFAAVGGGVAAVIEAVAHPAGAGELDPLEHVAGFFAGFQVHHADLLPVAAGGVSHDHDVLVVIGGAGEAGGDGAVLAQGVGVEEDLVFAIESFADVPYALVLQSVILADVVAVANLPGSAHLLEVEDLLVAVSDGVAERDGVQMAARHGILGFHPGAGLFTAVVFEPTVGVGDLGAKIGVHHLLGAGVRVVVSLHVVRLWSGAARRQNERCCGGEKEISHVVNRVAN